MRQALGELLRTGRKSSLLPNYGKSEIRIIMVRKDREIQRGHQWNGKQCTRRLHTMAPIFRMQGNMKSRGLIGLNNYA